MTDRPGPQAGGFLLASFILGGALIGVMRGQPSIGVIAGTGAGIAAALILWLADRRRAGR